MESGKGTRTQQLAGEEQQIGHDTAQSKMATPELISKYIRIKAAESTPPDGHVEGVA